MSIGKVIVNLDHVGYSRYVSCAWFECERSGVDLYKAFFHDHNREYPCAGSGAKHVWYVFCSMRCKAYFQNSHRSMGNLPAGMKATLG